MEAALESLEQAAAFSPSAPEILLLRAEIYIYQGWLEDALAILETLKDGAGRQLLSEIYFVESIAYEQQNMHERMYFSLMASLNEDPDNEEALERIWHSIDACKCYDEAAVLFEEILEHNAYCSIAWYNLGHVKAYQGHYGEAIDCYEYAYLANEKLEQAYRDCAELCFEMKQFHRALDCYEELLEKFEVDSDILQHIGQCNQHIGNYKIARTFYMQALKYDPLDDEVLFHIGECFAKEENWPRAIRYFQKAVSIEDSHEEYYGALAEAYRHSGNFKKAKINFEKAIDTAPEENRFWIRYALFLVENNRVDEAFGLLDDAEDNTIGVELAYCRVACLFLAGHRQEGLYRLGEALDEDIEAHRLLFSFNPGLEFDPDIISMISAYMM